MSLSDKPIMRDLKNMEDFVKLEDVKEAVKELKDTIFESIRLAESFEKTDVAIALQNRIIDFMK